MASLTNGGPKELLPVAGSTILELALSEAQIAEERVVVWSKTKGRLSFDGVDTVYQHRARGLGDAVRIGLRGRSEPALVILPDVLYAPRTPLARLADAVAGGASFAIAVERVPDHLVSRYGIAEFDEVTGRISRLLEKPSPDETGSRWAVSSRYALDRFTVAAIGAMEPPGEFDGETDLTSLLIPRLDARRGDGGFAFPLQEGETRYDCGSPEGYRRAVEALGQ